MKKIFILLLISCLFLGCGKIDNVQTDNTSAYSVTDAQGVTVDMPRKPERILTLSMSADTIILGMLPPNRLVAVDALLDDPISSTVVAQANQIPEKLKNPSIERIISLKPNLVIVMPWTSLDLVNTLRELQITVITCKAGNNVKDIEYNIELISRAVGEPVKGKQMIAMMEAKLQDIQEKVAVVTKSQPRKSTVLISLMNNYGGIGSAFDSMCTLAGVTNGLSVAGIQNGQTVTKETLLAINPDFLLMPTYNDHGNFDVNKFTIEYTQDPAL